MNVNRLRILCNEIKKTINNLNSDFIRDLPSSRETIRLVREKYMLKLIHQCITKLPLEAKA